MEGIRLVSHRTSELGLIGRLWLIPDVFNRVGPDRHGVVAAKLFGLIPQVVGKRGVSHQKNETCPNFATVSTK